MKPNRSRFDRFRPVTVRAAARLMTMASMGRLSPCEANAYLRAMAQTEPGVDPQAYRSLRKLGQRRSAFGHTGVFGASNRRSTKVQVTEAPECIAEWADAGWLMVDG